MLQRRVFEITIFVIYWVIAGPLIYDYVKDKGLFQEPKAYGIALAVPLVAYLCLARSFNCGYLICKNLEMKMYSKLWRQKAVLDKLERGALARESGESGKEGEVEDSNVGKPEKEIKETKEEKEIKKQKDKQLKELRKQKQEVAQTMLKEQEKVFKIAEQLLMQKAKQQANSIENTSQEHIEQPQLLVHSKQHAENVHSPLQSSKPQHQSLVNQPSTPLSNRKKSHHSQTPLIKPEIHSPHQKRAIQMRHGSSDAIFEELKSTLTRRVAPI